jgi:cilia- and flagella-associated protein 298
MPDDMQGLAPGQAEELNLVDDWADKCIAHGGWTPNPDPMGRRNGRQPSEEMQKVLMKTVQEAKTAVSKVNRF